MGKILGIDFGIKRTGLAITDDLKIIASGLDTVPTNQLMDLLKRMVLEEHIEKFVVGQAIRMSGEMSAVETNILELIKVLNKNFPEVTVSRQDERFTSKLALDAMITGGVKKKDRRNKQKGLVDKVSATLILQAYLENQ
ncbi:MAG: putative Holliday junction resolvase [Salibacteraceae bacterium]|jgi:putative Holliday junction resolvase